MKLPTYWKLTKFFSYKKLRAFSFSVFDFTFSHMIVGFKAKSSKQKQTKSFKTPENFLI